MILIICLSNNYFFCTHDKLSVLRVKIFVSTTAEHVSSSAFTLPANNV